MNENANLYELLGITNISLKYEMIPLEKLLPFANHPFVINRDESLQRLADDIKENGLIHTIIVRQYDFDGNYEILSGHRRTEAHKMAGINQIRSEIIKATDEQASRIVTLSNFLQREIILPSERAKSYQLRNKYLVNLKNTSAEKAPTADETRKNGAHSHGENQPQFDVAEKIGDALAKEFGESTGSIYRYIRLNYLIQELLNLVDAKRLRLLSAVELSFLSREQQKLIYQYFYFERRANLTPDMLADIRAEAKSKMLTESKLDQIVTRSKKTKEQKGGLTFKKTFVKRYLSHFDNKQEMMHTMERLLKEYVQK